MNKLVEFEEVKVSMWELTEMNLDLVQGVLVWRRGCRGQGGEWVWMSWLFKGSALVWFVGCGLRRGRSR